MYVSTFAVYTHSQSFTVTLHDIFWWPSSSSSHIHLITIPKSTILMFLGGETGSIPSHGIGFLITAARPHLGFAIVHRDPEKTHGNPQGLTNEFFRDEIRTNLRGKSTLRLR